MFLKLKGYIGLVYTQKAINCKSLVVIQPSKALFLKKYFFKKHNVINCHYSLTNFFIPYVGLIRKKRMLFIYIFPDFYASLCKYTFQETFSRFITEIVHVRFFFPTSDYCQTLLYQIFVLLFICVSLFFSSILWLSIFSDK